MKKKVLAAAIAAMCFVGTAPVSAVPITGVAENLQEQTVLTENDDAVTTTIAVTGTQPVTTITMPVVDDPTMQTSVVTVTIMDINGDIVLVKPMDGSPELKSSSKFSLSAKQLSADINPKVGMKLKVTYSGGILETYPAQFGNVQKVTIVSETANDKEAQKPLISEDDILELSKKGDELTWSDFEKYEFTDIGDGTNIWQFVIKNSGSKLLVIGRNLKEKPEHINCVWGNGAEFDIRTEDLTPWFYDGAITTTIAVTETKPVTTITMPVLDEPTIQTEVVTVTVMSVNGDDILVKPVDGSPELKSSSKFSMSAKEFPDDIKPKAGMKLEITYNGGILETYPAQFGNVQKIVAVKDDTVKNDGILLKGTKDMTLNDVMRLAELGDELDWADFKDYKGRDVGSGLYIWEYKLEDGYVLDVGGDIMTKPMYILLKRNNDKSIDIRTEDIKEYIASTATPVVTENEKVEATSPTSKSLIINDDINEYVEVIDAFMIQNKIDGDVSIHKIDGFDKVVVVCEKYDEHIKVKEYIESNGFDINKIHFGFTTSEGGLNSPDKLMGDANCDGQVDLSDAVMIMQALANPNKYGIDGTAEHHLTEQGKLNGDMNGDGLTVGDAQAIQRKLLGLDDTLTIQTPPATNSYSYESYSDLNEALIKQDSSILVDSNNYGELFNKTVSAFENKDIDLYVPTIDENVCALRNKEGFSNISLMTAELYNLPWIWYHCNVNDNDIDVKIAYHSVIESSELNSAKTYYEVLKLIAPDAPNPDNFAEFESYQKIYESEITLANGKKVVAMISEITSSNNVYVMFVYEGKLVSVYADKDTLSETFWSSFSLEKYNN